IRDFHVTGVQTCALPILLLVEKHYAALFETAPQLSRGVGNLVFTGDVDDPGTLETLSELGFSRPSDICRVIRTWHFGRYRATQRSEERRVGKAGWSRCAT